MPRTDLDCAETAPESCWLVCWSTNNVGKTTMIIINGWFKQSIWDISILDVPCHRKKDCLNEPFGKWLIQPIKMVKQLGWCWDCFTHRTVLGIRFLRWDCSPSFPRKPTNQLFPPLQESLTPTEPEAETDIEMKLGAVQLLGDGQS